MMEEFNQDKSNVLAKEILIELAYVGSIRISAQIIESGLIELEPKRLVASLMTMGTADGSLMRYYEKYPSKELLRNIMKFLFETRRQTINLRGILSEYEISKEILGSNEFKDREPPQGNGFQEDSVLILAASGHEKSYAYALQHYPQKLLKHINTRLYLTALKGNEDSMSKLEEMAEDGDKEAINTIYDIWRSKFAVDVVRKRAKDFIESNFDYFSDLFDKGAWQEFAKDPKHKEIIDGLLEDVKTDPKVLIILDWLGLLTKEHVAYHPFSEEVFHELRSHWVEGLEIYFSYEGNPNEIFRVLANEWQGFVVRNLVQSFMQFDKTKLRRLFMQSLPRLNITKALGYLKDDNEKLQLIMYALQHNIPQSKDILKAYIQHNPNMAWDLYAIYNSGVITMDRADNSVLKHNPQIKEVLATVDISAFKLDGFIDGLDPVVSELIAIGNQSIFDVALKQSVTKPGIANDLLQLAGVLPGNLKDYIKNMEIFHHTPKVRA
jgi:hypothetical protein